jgi:putative ABC transport system permease protein
MADRLFRLLLRLLPEEFRAGYGPDMEAAFRAERLEARAGRRWGALARLWLATAADVARHAPREHVEILRRDLRFAARLMAARTAHTAAAVLTLALGIGANVAMFAVVDAVLLAPLPYHDPDRLVAIAETEAGGDPSNLGYLTFVDLRGRSRSFEAMVAATASTATLTGGGLEAERVNAVRASRAYFDMLGVRPALGRVFREDEDRPGEARRVTILSDALWRRRFGADPDVVGKPVEISGIPFVVVGVLPASFQDLIAQRMYNGAELWTPLGYDPAASFACRTCRHLRVFGRLHPGVPPADAGRELGAIVGALETEFPREYHESGAQVTPLADVFLGPVRPALLVLWAGVGVLLLVACGNVANLLLLRASERAHEVSVRAALGVTRRRLARQLLTESLLLASAGGAAGVAIGAIAVGVLRSSGFDELPRLASASLDLRAVLVAVSITGASGLLFGLVPLRQLLRRDASLRAGGGRRLTAAAAVWRARFGLVAANVAMATLLIVGSGLLVRSLMGLLAVSPGVDPAGVATMQIWATGERFRAGESDEQIATAVGFYDAVLSRIRALPEVTAAGAVTTLPLGGGVDGYGLHIEGRLLANPEAAPSADRFVVAGDYFEALRIPLRRGRLIDARDRQTTEPVAVINETMARELFASEDSIGQRVRLGPATANSRVVVGVVGDVRHHGLDVPVGYQVYLPQSQWAWAETALTLVVRSRTDPAPVIPAAREIVREIDPAQPVTHARLYEDVVAATTGTRRFAARLLTAFAATALLLSAIGLYGALGVTVGQRQREMGIRAALGAPAGALRRMVLGQGLRPVGFGLVAGLVAAALAASSLRTLLYGVQASDPATFGFAALLVVGSALAACIPQAARASRVDPALTLRAE